MAEILFGAVVENFVLIPCVRMTQKSKWTKRAKQYLENQKLLSWELVKYCPVGFCIDYPVELTFVVHRPNRRKVDADNCIKSIQDALQYAGIVTNDNLIQGYGKSRIWFDGQAKVIVELRRL